MAKKKRGSSSQWVIYVACGVVCILGICIMTFAPLPSTISLGTSSPQNSQLPGAKDTSKSNDGIPTYEQYIQMSKERNWSPVDPLDKLKTTCRKCSQVSTQNVFTTISLISELYLCT